MYDFILEAGGDFRYEGFEIDNVLYLKDDLILSESCVVKSIDLFYLDLYFWLFVIKLDLRSCYRPAYLVIGLFLSSLNMTFCG